MIGRVRGLTRDLVAHALFTAGLTRPRIDRLTIVTFHRVLPAKLAREYPIPGLVVTPDELRWVLDFVVRRYACDSLEGAFERWSEGERPARPLLAVTFDDGQKDNLEHAAPLLAEFGVRATFFATAAHVESGEPIWHDRLSLALRRAQDRSPEGVTSLMASLPDARGARTPLSGLLTFAKTLPRSALRALVERTEQLAGGVARHPWDAMMTWNDLAELASAGHEIASHTLSHPILPNCSAEEIEEEVVDSKRRIEQRLGRPVTSFAYPNGDYDARTLAAVRRAGYRRAVTTRGGTNRPGAPPLELRRCDVVAEHARDRHGALSGPRLAWRLSDLRPGLR